MRVPIDTHARINLNAPTLPAYEAEVDGSVYWLVWCKYCNVWHRHGPAEAHCDKRSPYFVEGYNLAYAGNFHGSWNVSDR